MGAIQEEQAVVEVNEYGTRFVHCDNLRGQVEPVVIRRFREEFPNPFGGVVSLRGVEVWSPDDRCHSLQCIAQAGGGYRVFRRSAPGAYGMFKTLREAVERAAQVLLAHRQGYVVTSRWDERGTREQF